MPKTLEQSIQLHRDGIKRFVDAADAWKKKGNSGWELFCIYHAVQDSLCIAVTTYDSPAQGISYLRTEFETAIFERAFGLVRKVHLLERNDLTSPPASIASLILCVHAAWLLRRYIDAKEMASICADADRLRCFQVHGLWQDYSRGIAAVANGGEFTPRDRKYQGYDKHWATYLHLMADICAAKDLITACKQVDESFVRRNQDKRLISDGLDGDGTFPVKWDFRKHSLLMAIAAKPTE